MNSFWLTAHCRHDPLFGFKAPSPAGEGWGEENKIKSLYSPHPGLLPLEKEQ